MKLFIVKVTCAEKITKKKKGNTTYPKENEWTRLTE